MSEAITASIYVKYPQLVEYLNSIPPHNRSKHIRKLIEEDMNKNWTVIDSDPDKPAEDPQPAPVKVNEVRTVNNGKGHQQKNPSENKPGDTSPDRKNSTTPTKPSSKTQHGPTREVTLRQLLGRSHRQTSYSKSGRS